MRLIMVSYCSKSVYSLSILYFLIEIFKIFVAECKIVNAGLETNIALKRFIRVNKTARST